jgi:hypothetical protein
VECVQCQCADIRCVAVTCIGLLCLFHENFTKYTNLLHQVVSNEFEECDIRSIALEGRDDMESDIVIVIIYPYNLS